jgi:hypothetical protein
LASLRSSGERERDDRDDEIARLKSKVGEITMDNELLYAKIEADEGQRLPSWRVPRRRRPLDPDARMLTRVVLPFGRAREFTSPDPSRCLQ